MPANQDGPADPPEATGLAEPAEPGQLSGLAAVFEPRRIALVGASDRPGSVGRLLWDNLAGFPGEVLPVCRGASVGGTPAQADLRDVPGPIDLAIVATPAASVPAVIEAAARKRVGAAVVLSAGFAETGPAGAALQAQALAAARAGGVRLVGPNCFGVQNADLPLNASIATGLPRGGGGVSIVTQSGSYGMAAHALGAEEAMRVAKVYAAGNKADITDAELLAYLREDPATTVICLLLESIGDGRAFFEQACLTTAVKPVIAAVSGRTGAGQRAALSHTAALASADAVRDAALAQAGVVRVRTGLQALDAARGMAAQRAPRGPRVAVVTNSGGAGVELADLLADEGLEVPELSAGLQDRLREVLPGYASAANPVDMTPAWSLFTTVYPAAIEMLARSGEVDVIVPVLLQRSASEPVAASVRDAVAALRAGGNTVPVYVCWVAPRSGYEPAALLQEAGVPCFPWPERTAQAVGAAVRAGLALADGTAAGEPLTDGPQAGPPRVARPPEAAFAQPRRAVGPGSVGGLDRTGEKGLLGHEAARELLAGAGIALVESVRCASPGEAFAAADRLGLPVVVKVDHPALTHKSDAGGVRLGLASENAVRRAASDLLALADGAAVLVQPQRSGVEIAVGGVRDPGFGPVVMAGLGGVLVEVSNDVRLAVAPVDDAQAAAMLAALRGAAVLDGARGRPAADTGALATLISRVSRLLVDFPEIAELDLNPVLAGPAGCVAVDWRIRIG
ncbi:MAG TPA: acetate--CoA ligase family protein [Streptosporangiaceae bacterium]